jgi:hypothetical protein
MLMLRFIGGTRSSLITWWGVFTAGSNAEKRNQCERQQQ